MKKINQLTVKYHSVPVGTLSLSLDGRTCCFEYHPEWIANGFSISPLELPLKPGIFNAKPVPFHGNFGIFEDSLPDGYGRYLLHKTLLKEGINDFELNAIDRLSIIGESAMGALCYSPQQTMIKGEENNDLDFLQEKALEVLSEMQDTDAELLLFNSGNSGGARPKAIFNDSEGHWLVKFRHTYDPADMGVAEFTYNELAQKCNIDTPDFKLINGKYFASRRFDIDNEGNRIHTATAGALLGISLTNPILDYGNLLALTGFLSQNIADIEQMYKRMVFNYVIGNRDDHCKNFSFYVLPDKSGRMQWHLAPAYDLTAFSEGFNGEHATSVNGKGRPDLADFIAVGKKARIAERRCRDIIAEIEHICAEYAVYSPEA